MPVFVLNRPSQPRYRKIPMVEILDGKPLFALDAIVLDTEASGLDAAKARIVQFGAVRVANGLL